MITEKISGWSSSFSGTLCDSVFVTTPTGVSTSYSIPNLSFNPSGHDKQLNIIINGITALGYRPIDGNWNYPISVLNNAVPNVPFLLRTMLLGIP